MDAYKTPDSDLEAPYNMPFRPIRAILLGLSITIPLLLILSVILAIVFAIIAGIDFNEADNFERALTTSPLFMIFDLIFSTLMCYFSGVVTGKNVPGKEYKYAIIVATITLLTYLGLTLVTDPKYSYPLWFNIASYLLVPSAIFLGARPAH